MSHSGAAITTLIASYLADAQPAASPIPVRQEALRSFFNIIGCTLGGATQQGVDIACRAL